VSRIVLIAGLIPYESGKTWFTLSSALYARKQGLMVKVFKPVAGHNLWYSPLAVKETLKLKLLVGNDVTIYYKNNLVEEPAIANPISIATAPPDPLIYSGRIDNYMRDLEETYSTTVLSRITNCNSKAINHHVHLENLEKTTPEVKKFIVKLASLLKAEEYPLLKLVNYMFSSSVNEDLDKCLEHLEKNSELVFVESFNDAITPYHSVVEKAGLIAIVAPSRVLVYEDTEKIRELLERNTEKLGFEGFRAKYFIDKLKPDIVLNTEFASKPSPRRAHAEFVNYILRKT